MDRLEHKHYYGTKCIRETGRKKWSPIKDALQLHHMLAMNKSFSVKCISIMSKISLTLTAPITRILRGSIVG